MDMFISMIVVSVSQCICISKHQVVHYIYALLICQLYLNKAGGK